jgi:hypothetical protein
MTSRVDIHIATEQAKRDKYLYLKYVQKIVRLPAQVVSILYKMGEIPPAFPLPAIALQVIHAYEPDDGYNGDVHYIVIEDYTNRKADVYWPNDKPQYNIPWK